MDNASATPVRLEVKEAMLPYLDEHFANPSTVYDLGTRVRDAVEDAREKTGRLIGAEADRIVFTSSGAEANNMAVKGAALANRKKGNRVIISGIEHHSVLNAARFLERLDFEVTFLPVDEYGRIDPERLERILSPDTVLVSVMHANNEIGTMQPVSELASVCRRNKVLFHTDAVASVGAVPVDVQELGVDMLSFSGNGLQAPKGIGGLYIGKNVRVMPLIHGGIQERGLRAGTENVPGIVGLGKAAELAAGEMDADAPRIREMRDRLVRGITETIASATYTGHPDHRLPGHASFCFQAVEGEALLFTLAQKGIYANTGSACASKALKISPVLAALSLPHDVAQGSVVFTLNRNNTAQEVDYVLEHFPPAVQRLRSFSPLWREVSA
jgi:cysteine desulfurase